MQVSPHTGWFPAKIGSFSGRPHVIAVKFDVAHLSKPFLEFDLDTATESAAIPLDEVVRWDFGNPPPPAGFIFHMSRTGSTAAGLMLRAAGNVTFIGEPLPINGLFFRPDDTADEPLLEAQVRALVNWFAAAARGRRVVVKLSSWLSLHLDRFQAWFPQVPIVFMYREPIDVVSALVDKAPFMFRRAAMRAQFAAPPPGQPDYEAWMNASLRGRVDYRRDCDYVEFVARFLGAICAPAAATASEPNPVLGVEYARFSAQVIQQVAPRFGIDVDADAHERMEAVTRYHVKQRTNPAAFHDDSALKRLKATPLMHELADRFIQPSVDILRRLA